MTDAFAKAEDLLGAADGREHWPFEANSDWGTIAGTERQRALRAAKARLHEKAPATLRVAVTLAKYAHDRVCGNHRLVSPEVPCRNGSVHCQDARLALAEFEKLFPGKEN